MSYVKRCRCTAGLMAVLLVMMPSVATSSSLSLVRIKVTIVEPPPCTINDDRPIEVEFGDVMTTRVDGSNYRMLVNYTLSCSGATSNTMKLQVQGEGAGFDGTVLKTNKSGLGIELRQNDSKLAVNSWLNFNYPNTPELWAVPVKQSRATLTGGEFSAAATMKVAYQ